jgi:hypothetical protein
VKRYCRLHQRSRPRAKAQTVVPSGRRQGVAREDPCETIAGSIRFVQSCAIPLPILCHHQSRRKVTRGRGSCTGRLNKLLIILSDLLPWGDSGWVKSSIGSCDLSRTTAGFTTGECRGASGLINIPARAQLDLTTGMILTSKNDRIAPHSFLISSLKRLVYRSRW